MGSILIGAGGRLGSTRPLSRPGGRVEATQHGGQAQREVVANSVGLLGVEVAGGSVLVEAEQRGEQLVALGFVGAMRSAVAPGVLGPLGTGRAGPGIPSISRSSISRSSIG